MSYDELLERNERGARDAAPSEWRDNNEFAGVPGSAFPVQRFRVYGSEVAGSRFRVGVSGIKSSWLKTGGFQEMKITKFEEIEAWQLARELTREVYRLIMLIAD